MNAVMSKPRTINFLDLSQPTVDRLRKERFLKELPLSGNRVYFCAKSVHAFRDMLAENTDFMDMHKALVVEMAGTDVPVNDPLDPIMGARAAEAGCSVLALRWFVRQYRNRIENAERRARVAA